MDNIWDLYQFLMYVIDKFGNGVIQPPECTPYIVAAQLDLYTTLMSERSAGDKEAENSLVPFLRPVDLTSDANGLVIPPYNWDATQLIQSVQYTEPIRKKLPHELPEALKSQMYPVPKYPIYSETSFGIQLYPKTYTNVTLMHYATPVAPVIGFTELGGEPVYDPATSVQLTCNKSQYMSVAQKALIYLGVRLADAEVAQLGGLYQGNNIVTAG